jgi:hypothetical protein
LTCERSSLPQQSHFIYTPTQAPLEKPREATVMLTARQSATAKV